MESLHDWQNCIQWLAECQIIPPDHKLLVSPSIGPKDLALYLRDGVVLCHLLNKIEPGMIDNKDFSQHPQLSQFLCKLNASVFIQKCKTKFGLTECDLFDSCDLYQLSNFDQVLKTLSALSLSEKAIESNIKQLVLSRNSHYDLKVDSEASLETDMDNYITDENTYQNMSGKDIYDDLCSIRTSLQQKESNAAPISKRDLCIRELVMTERKYIEALKMIKLYFMKPLQSVFSASDHRTIFHGIEKLWQTHVDFEASLKSATTDTEMLIPDCFIANKEKFLFYGEFCSNLTTGQELLDKLIETNPIIMQKVRDCEQFSVNEGKFKLRDLLALPMQRILKYHLFLKEIIKHTEDGSQNEKLMLERALDEIQDLSLFINEVKRDNDTIGAMQLVQSSILDLPTSLTLKDCGRFIMDAELKLRSEPEHSVNSRQLFLFDMTILVCKSKGDNATYSYKGVITLNDFVLEQNLIKEKGMNGFQLSHKTNKTHYHVIYAKKTEVRDKWMKAVELAMDNIEPPHAINELHDFHMWSFGKPTICDVCRKLLRGVFYQGYRCSKTKMAVHKDCLEGAKDMTGPPTCTLPPRSHRMGYLVPRSPVPSSIYPSAKVKAIESYSGSPPPLDNLTPLIFEVNDVIKVFPNTPTPNSNTDDAWFEGELNGQRGFFPRKAVRSHFQQQKSMPYEAHSLQRSASSILPSSVSPHPCHNLGRTSQPGQGGLTSKSSLGDANRLHSKDWFVGELSRDDATANLIPTPEGTFLARLSVEENRKGEFAISIKINDTVKHMKVGRTSSGECFLSQSKLFWSIIDLVEHYQANSLESLFPEVKSPLVHPFHTIVMRQGSHNTCVAVFDYHSPSNNHLSFNRGEKIEVIHKVGDSSGWWKGRIGNKVGYFPVTYVREL